MNIKTLEDFIKQIKDLKPCEEGYVRFYRGQSVDKPLVPNVFREKCFIDNEGEIYNEIINKKPEEFSNCKCTFDYLVKMQHYGTPTRLLDITSNPLVALYFACSENPQKPTVYCLDIPVRLMKNYNSDSVTILSTMARFDELSKNEVLKAVDFITKVREVIRTVLIEKLKLELNRLGIQQNDDTESRISNIRDLALPEILSKLRDDSRFWINIEVSEFSEIIREVINKTRDTILDGHQCEKRIDLALDEVISKINNPRLLHEIKQDKPYFQDLMHIGTFNTIYCVKPRLDNPRIIKQNGAFLIFPHAEYNLEVAKNIVINKIPINTSKASSIIGELSIVDVNKESLFNDMDSVASAICEKYKKKEC